MESKARKERLDIYEGLNQVTLVPASASTGRRGRGAGFYCEACDLTFKDSLDYADHLNSKRHLYAIGETERTTRATLKDVQDRLEYLRKKVKEAHAEEEVDIMKRIELRKQVEERDRIARRQQKANRKQRKRQETSTSDSTADPSSDAAASDMASIMGFSGFGTTNRN